MVITRSLHQHLFKKEAQRLSCIEFQLADHPESSHYHTIYRPTFVTTMEEQFMHTLAKEQIKTLEKFGGGAHEDVVKWLQNMEEAFDRAQVQSSNKYSAIQWYLTDAAAKWFRHNKSIIPDWSTFKTELIKAYQPSLHQILLRMEQRQQLPEESVMEYYYDKIQLCLQADPHMSSAMIVHHLTKGLKHSLLTHMIRRHPSTPSEFLTVAQDEEKILLTLNGLSHTSTNSLDNYPYENDPINNMVTLVQGPTSASNRQQQTSPQPLMKITPANRCISSSGHRYYRQNPSPSFNSRQCYACHRFGHIAKQCPNRKNI